jgi:hypothetical protein
LKGSVSIYIWVYGVTYKNNHLPGIYVVYLRKIRIADVNSPDVKHTLPKKNLE